MKQVVVKMFRIVYLAILFLLLRNCYGFLTQDVPGFNTTSYVADKSYRELVSLIVDEKNFRHQLETYVATLVVRLNSLEQFRADATKELIKGKNNRQQLADQNTKVSLDFANASEDLRELKSDFENLRQDFENATKSYREQTKDVKEISDAISNITTRHDKIERNLSHTVAEQQNIEVKLSGLETESNHVHKDIQSITYITDNFERVLDYLRDRIDNVTEEVTNITQVNELLNQTVSDMITFQETSVNPLLLNLSYNQSLLSENYHNLLEQYLVISSHIGDKFVEKQEFTSQIQDMAELINDLNSTILHHAYSHSTGSRNNTLKGSRIGFSLRGVNKTASSDRLKFENVIFDSGNVFNMASGQFVCNQAGMYFFIATVVREPGIYGAHCSIFVNRAGKQATVGQASTTAGYATGVAALVKYLNVGDNVYLAACHGVDHMYFATSFSGFLIVPD